MRALEGRVVEAGGRQPGKRIEPGNENRRDAEPAKMRHLTPDVVELRVTLPAEVAALLERAMQGAKRASEQSMSDAEAFEAVARDALAAQDDGDSDPRRTVVLHECRHCEKAALETGVEPAQLRPVVAASLGCGAKVVDLQTAGHEAKRGGPMPDPFTATQGGSPNEDATTHIGSPNQHATQRGSPTQAKLLATMGRRAGWSPDALCEATGLPIHEIQAALLPLILAGRVAQDTCGRLAPCG
jgi:DprA winged helix domain